MARRCTKCLRELPLHQFTKAPRHRDGVSSQCKPCFNVSRNAWRHRNPDKQRQAVTNTHRKLKAAVLSGYGGRCRCCGETTVSMLDIDHVNPVLRAEQKRIWGSVPSGRTLWSDAINRDFSADYQILCCNCNQSKRRNGGRCQHADLHAEQARLIGACA